jgi:molecular chaperone DnaK
LNGPFSASEVLDGPFTPFPVRAGNTVLAFIVRGFAWGGTYASVGFSRVWPAGSWRVVVPYAVGVDLGTTFTSAAVGGPGGTRVVSLSPRMTVPSVACRAQDGSLLTGTAALDAAVDPALVARGFKRRLGDPTPLVLGGHAYQPAALMAAQLRAVLDLVILAHGGEPPGTVMLTCPAIWGPYRREQFAEVPRLAGVTDYQLITEPEAAATHYSVERRLGDGEVVAVYDLGGGTFDTTILRMRAGGMEILGTPEGIEHLGGIDFDETLLTHLDDRLDGAIDDLDADDPATAATLAAIRAMCVRAKEELSIEPDVVLTVPLPSGTREVTVTRLEFNDMIRPSVQLTTDALHRTISSAGLRPDDLSAVLLAGGSSRIPLVSQLVSKEFGKPVRVTLHPKFTVALGAAAVAVRRLAGPSTPAAPAPRRAYRPKWLVPILAAVVVVIVAAIATFSGEDGQPDAASGVPATTPAAPPVLRIYHGGVVEPWAGFVASPDNWGGTELGPQGGRQTAITATPDGNGLRTAWTGSAPAQVYLQNVAGPRNLKSYVDARGALVFDVLVHRPPAGRITLAVHCLYPCAAEVPATALFRKLPAKERTTVTIPLSCFTKAGLDPTRVNTPFLVYADARFDVTFSEVHWQPGAATTPEATACEDLR